MAWDFVKYSDNFTFTLLRYMGGGIAQKSQGARSEFNSAFGLEKVDRWHPIRISAIQSRSHPMQLLGFPKHEKGAPRKEIPK
jgi:hypothetical protein